MVKEHVSAVPAGHFPGRVVVRPHDINGHNLVECIGETCVGSAAQADLVMPRAELETRDTADDLALALNPDGFGADVHTPAGGYRMVVQIQETNGEVGILGSSAVH